MFMNNKEEIINWIYDNIDCVTLQTFYYDTLEDVIYDSAINGEFKRREFAFDKLFYFSEIKEQLILNTYSDFQFDVNENICELPFKLGMINGDFIIMDSNLESFKGFPSIIRGDLEWSDNNIKSSKYWEVEEIEGNINLCSLNCELDNLKFLENTEFEKFIMKVTNTPFKNDNISEIEMKYIKYENKIQTFYHSDLNNYLKDLDNLNNDCDNYLDSFDNKQLKI